MTPNCQVTSKFVTAVIGKIQGVRKTTTSIVPLVLKDVYQWHIPASILEDQQAEREE
jgi:hypothetical protein